MAETKRFAGLSTRSQLKAANNLGVVLRQEGKNNIRKVELELLDAYYEGRQYVGKAPWNQSEAIDGTYVPVRDRIPPLQFNFAKVMCSRISSKLVGRNAFPKVKIEDDPDTEEFIRVIKQNSRLEAFMIEPVRRMCNAGSVLIRFSIVEGAYKLQFYLAKWCFPEFDAAGNLEFVKIQYVFDDEADLDAKKVPKKKWFRMDLGKMKDVLYDTPEFSSDAEPRFEVVATANHELGFVQAEWLKTSDKPNSIDGPSLIEGILPFIDELNYSMSQSSTAIQYNQDPQLMLKNMDEDEVEQLIRSSVKAWNLGREGEAAFLEAGMAGVEAAQEFRDKVRLNVQDIARVVLLDPEKVVGHAQSAKAMEVLHGPMVELIEELRPQLEKGLINFCMKMMLATLIQNQRGAPVPVNIPPGYKPTSLNVTVSWPEIFPPTMEDLRTKVAIATSVTSANIISRETAMKWIAKDFGVEDIEEELNKVDTQKVINPFGAF